MQSSEFDVCQKRARRIPYPVRVILQSRDSGERFEGQARDLSMGGMFIETMLPLDPGTVCKIEFPAKPLRFHGMVEVLWSRYSDGGKDLPPGMAVRWFDLSLAQKKLLFRQIDDHVRGGGGLFAGTPDAEREGGSAGPEGAASGSAKGGRVRLIVGLAAAAVVVVVVLILLL